MTKIQTKAMQTIQAQGFTFLGDSIFSTFVQARRCMNGLVRMGMVKVNNDEFGTNYTLAEGV